MGKLINSFRYALDGLAHALVTQRNMRIHFIAAFAVVALCTLIRVSTPEIVAALFSVTLVITLELVNTAVEHVTDLLTKEWRPHAKVAKDVAAAAVFIAAVNALTVAYLIFYDKLDPVLWRQPQTLLKPPFMGVILLALLFLLVAVVAYAVAGVRRGRLRRRQKES